MLSIVLLQSKILRINWVDLTLKRFDNFASSSSRVSEKRINEETGMLKISEYLSSNSKLGDFLPL